MDGAAKVEEGLRGCLLGRSRQLPARVRGRALEQGRVTQKQHAHDPDASELAAVTVPARRWLPG